MFRNVVLFPLQAFIRAVRVYYLNASYQVIMICIFLYLFRERYISLKIHESYQCMIYNVPGVFTARVVSIHRNRSGSRSLSDGTRRCSCGLHKCSPFSSAWYQSCGSYLSFLLMLLIDVGSAPTFSNTQFNFSSLYLTSMVHCL